jgi:hypothetical protein
MVEDKMQKAENIYFKVKSSNILNGSKRYSTSQPGQRASAMPSFKSKPNSIDKAISTNTFVRSNRGNNARTQNFNS